MVLSFSHGGGTKSTEQFVVWVIHYKSVEIAIRSDSYKHSGLEVLLDSVDHFKRL